MKTVRLTALFAAVVVACSYSASAQQAGAAKDEEQWKLAEKQTPAVTKTVRQLQAIVVQLGELSLKPEKIPPDQYLKVLCGPDMPHPFKPTLATGLESICAQLHCQKKCFVECTPQPVPHDCREKCFSKCQTAPLKP